MTLSLPDTLAEINDLKERGDLLLAFDRACEYLAKVPDAEEVKHAGLLALARTGATDRAEHLFKEWGLQASPNPEVLALEARLAKDRALKLDGEERRTSLLHAASIYQTIFESKPSYYTAINWASLSFLGGDRAQAEPIAARVLADPKVSGAADYWSLATRAEANLLLGRLDAALADLEAAAALSTGAGTRSTTRRQLRLILAESGHGPHEIARFLQPLDPPLTLHYCGTRLSPDHWQIFAEPARASLLKERVSAILDQLKPGSLFGSLGSAPEIVFAEEALARGVRLDVVLPLPKDNFAEIFLKSADADWQARFHAACAQARRVVVPSDDAYADDPNLAPYAARVAMGLALLRAQHVDGETAQVVLLEGHESGPTPEAAQIWQRDGRPQHVIAFGLGLKAEPIGQPVESRPTHAVIFGDLPGFSKLPERYLPPFWDVVMKAIGDIIKASGADVVLKNTWGDAVHLVLSDVKSAASICLAMQKNLAAIDGRILGREDPPIMRIGAHYGPVFSGWDHIENQKTYYGRALSWAARIEPITPPGMVYVTEAFAAILLLESRGEFTCTYVGQVPLAKGYGTFRMYDLSHAIGV